MSPRGLLLPPQSQAWMQKHTGKGDAANRGGHGLVGGLQTSSFLQDSPDPTLRPPGTSLTSFSLLSRLLLLLPSGMCQVCAGLRLQGPPLC